MSYLPPQQLPAYHDLQQNKKNESLWRLCQWDEEHLSLFLLRESKCVLCDATIMTPLFSSTTCTTSLPTANLLARSGQPELSRKQYAAILNSWITSRKLKESVSPYLQWLVRTKQDNRISLGVFIVWLGSGRKIYLVRVRKRSCYGFKQSLQKNTIMRLHNSMQNQPKSA